MTDENIKDAIAAYAAEAGLKPSTVSLRATGNSRLFDTLCAGGSCTLKTAQRVLDFIASNPPSSAAGKAGWS